MKILIIDDSKTHLHITNKIVSNLKNHQTILALDGLEGFAILRTIPDIDFIIVDYKMPYINGVDFIKKIRDTDPFKEIPIVVSSACDLSPVYFEAGATHCLVKPFSLTGFKDIIYKVSISAKHKSA